MEPGATRSQAMSDAAATSERIERLLDQVRATAGPLAWQRVDELLTALVDLYGRALGRMLEAIEPERRRALADDELLGSLLALHQLSPLRLDERVQGALAALAPSFGALELVALEGGTLKLRAVDAPPIAGAAQAIEAALVEAAPELLRVEIDGLREPAARGGLVHIDLARSRARAGGG